MRVFLFYNEDAGQGLSADEMQRAIEAAGHRLVGAATPDGRIGRALGDAEVVVVAGGDGTVGKVVRALHRAIAVPLAILPSGTANNIAESLGLRGEHAALLAGLGTATPRRLDVGLASGTFGERPFLESFGTGLIAQGILAMDREAPHAEQGDREAMTAKARHRFAEVLATLKPQRLVLFGSGQRREAELLLLEVLNVGSIGPSLPMCRQVDCGDGRFEVLMAAADERAALDRLLRSGQPAELPGWSAGELTVVGCDWIHLDDWTCEVGRRPVTLRVVPGALRVLVP